MSSIAVNSIEALSAPSDPVKIGGAVSAWVHFNGVTGAITAQFNVLSVEPLGGGDYKFTFRKPIPTSDPCVFGSCWDSSSVGLVSCIPARVPSQTTTVVYASTRSWAAPATVFANARVVFV